MKELAVKLENVSFRYGNSPVLTDVSLEVEAGDFLAMIGPNGGGKTTLLKIMAGLLKPQTGSVLVNGVKVPSAKARIGYVPQNTNLNLEFPITVGQCVATGAKAADPESEIVQSSLAKVEMEAFSKRMLGELSGGERQRVLVARALASNPKLLFLDEPSSNMDAPGQSSLFRLLSELDREMTIILVSHDIGAISKYVRSVACVNRLVHFHPGAGISGEFLHEVYGCDMELLTHGVFGHRVLSTHDHSRCRQNL